MAQGDNFRGKGEPGRGAPKGNKNGKGRRWSHAIEKAVKQYADGNVEAGRALDRMAHRLVKEALYGEDYKFAMTEIGNRLDGKPTEHKVVDQSVTSYGSVSEALGILREFARQSEADGHAGVVSH
jgi:hypothetical protein